MQNTAEKRRVYSIRHRGMVLIGTIFVALLMAVLIMTFVNVTAADLRLITHRVATLKAYYVAEAGVEDGLDYLRQNGAGAYSPGAKACPTGSSDAYTVTINSDGTQVTSTGVVSSLGFTRKIQATVAVTGSSPPYTVTISKWEEVAP